MHNPLFSMLSVLSLLIIAAPALAVRSHDIEHSIRQTLTEMDVRYRFYEDPSGGASLDDVLLLEDEQFQTTDNEGVNFGFSRSAYWIKFHVVNHSQKPVDVFVEVAYPRIDHVTFYQVTDKTVNQQLVTGDRRNFYPRAVDHPNFVFPVALSPEQSSTVYIRTQTTASTQYPLKLVSPAFFYEKSNKENLFHFFYFGAMSVMIILNLVVFTRLREKTYLYYACALSSFYLFFFCLRGFSLQLLWPQYFLLDEFIFRTSMPLLAIFSLQFTRHFLSTYNNHRHLDRALRAVLILEFINLTLTLVFHNHLSTIFSIGLGIPLWAVLFISGPIAWYRGSRAGAYFSIAWTLLTFGIVFKVIHQFGVLPNSLFIEHGMQVGSGLEALVLTIALAERLYQEREEKIAAQAQSLKESQNRRDAQNQVIHMALHDSVTTLPNRALFEMRLNDLITSDKGKQYIIGLISLSQLPDIGKTLGLAYTEQLRASFALRANSILSELKGTQFIEQDDQFTAWACTINSYIFGVIIDLKEASISRKNYYSTMERFREPFDFQGLTIEIPVSFGASRYPMDGCEPADLVRRALVSLGEAKNFDFNFAFFTKEMDVYDSQRLSILTDLRKALSCNKTMVNYQPQVSLDSGRVIGLEALIRWEHNVHGFIPPVQFIPLAEKTGVIRDVTRRIIEQSLADIKTIHEKHPSIKVSVNISAKNLVEPDLVHWIMQKLAEHQVKPSTLSLELTETSVMSNVNEAIKTLALLDAKGIAIAIDDFGTGYSSLHYLSTLPVKEIKIDRSLVDDICLNKDSRIIVQKTIEICQSLGYQVVAEGIETQDQYEQLRQMSCDIGQGYLISKPVPLTKLLQWLEQKNNEPIDS